MESTRCNNHVYGKPHSITRGTLTRRFIYDGYQRLCCSHDPEAGWSVQSYYPEIDLVSRCPHPKPA